MACRVRLGVRTPCMTDELTNCREKVAQLVEENAMLRQANEDFGSLAERLNDALQTERRRGSDRRVTLRSRPDRRHPLRGEEGG